MSKVPKIIIYSKISISLLCVQNFTNQMNLIDFVRKLATKKRRLLPTSVFL